MCNSLAPLFSSRFHRSLHQTVRRLAEDVLGFKTLCYTDPLEREKEGCGTPIRQIVSTRGKTFGLSASGSNAEDAFSKYTPKLPYVINPNFRWGPKHILEKPRDPYDFLRGPGSLVKEIAERWDELSSEQNYTKAMEIADEIITNMKGGTYDGIPYSEISLLQAATKEGLTQEEIQLFFHTDFGVAENVATRMSLENLGQLEVRYLALRAEPIDGPKEMVTLAEIRGGIPRRIGMRSIIDKLLRQTKKAGGRIFYNSKVTSISRSQEGSSRILVKFADGDSVVTDNVIANIGKPDLLALGLESEPVKSSSEEFRRSVERMHVLGLAKTYCFWNDAWWLTKMKTSIGRIRLHAENMFSMRYHDGHFICKNPKELEGCRGGVLVSYVLGDNSGAGSAIYTHTHNAVPFTPLTNSDNIHRFVNGNMSATEQLYFDDLHDQIRRVHKSSLSALGLDVEDAIPPAVGCVMADWREVGTHVQMGPGKGNLNMYELFTKPVPDLNIALVNEAWGQDQGWAESSLNSAERALFHHYRLEKPSWMDNAFHSAVIKRYNQGY